MIFCIEKVEFFLSKDGKYYRIPRKLAKKIAKEGKLPFPLRTISKQGLKITPYGYSFNNFQSTGELAASDGFVVPDLESFKDSISSWKTYSKIKTGTDDLVPGTVLYFPNSSLQKRYNNKFDMFSFFHNTALDLDEKSKKEIVDFALSASMQIANDIKKDFIRSKEIDYEDLLKKIEDETDDYIKQKIEKINKNHSLVQKNEIMMKRNLIKYVFLDDKLFLILRHCLCRR